MGSRLPFGQAAELTGHFRMVDVSEATVRRTTERSGQAWVELQREAVEALEAEPRERLLQQLSVDGAMVPLLHGEWAEVKTLVIGTIEEPASEGEAHAQLSYFSRMMDHQSFARLATVETHRRGTERAARVCAVMDGAEWQQKFIDLHRPDARASGLVPRCGTPGAGGPSRFRSGDCGPERVAGTVAPVETRGAGRGAG